MTEKRKNIISLQPVTYRIQQHDLWIGGGQQALQLMESAYLDLRLEDFWDHPDHRGWVLLFTQWARGPLLRKIYEEIQEMFGIRFIHFCTAAWT